MESENRINKIIKSSWFSVIYPFIVLFITFMISMIYDLVKNNPFYSTFVNILKFRIPLWVSILVVIVLVGCFIFYIKRFTISKTIERYNDYLYITLKKDPKKIKYCSCCYDTKRKFVQILCNDKSGISKCPICKTSAVYDKKINDKYNNTTKKSRNYRNYNASQEGFSL